MNGEALTPRQKLAINKQYLKQTFIDAFSSKDLVHWKKHPRVLEIRNVKWAEFAVWAPSAIEANGKYYLFFAANDGTNGAGNPKYWLQSRPDTVVHPAAAAGTVALTGNGATASAGTPVAAITLALTGNAATARPSCCC